MSHSPTGRSAHANRLARETSPYLLQHQHNPVDWYPWGPEAIERARREDKPIFLSVGYSTCYWCHVMERQSFENESVAAVMNELFVNVKVDREERPDVDQLYMAAVQVLTRRGGWPMSVWLTPDLRPFYGGTYYPPDDQHGRPGFVTLLRALADAYHDRRADVDRTSGQIMNILRQIAEPDAPPQPIRIDDAFVADLVERSTADYDATHGGFGGAPKFPRETLLELLLVYSGDEPETAAAAVTSEISDLKSDVRRRVLHTLDALAAGGIRDHLGGGFHRYSTDARWLVPHFEIMLYDNGMTAACFAEAFRQTREPRYASVTRGILDFVLRKMTSSDGAFYTAMDAEVDGREGLNYLWTPAEVEAVLGPEDAEFFNRVYGLHLGPNFADPHHGSGTPDKNILFLPKPLEEVARDLGTSPDALDARLQPMRLKLKAARDLRKQPLLDTKVLTSWNALMIRAFALAGHALDEQRYIIAATRAAEFLLARHRTPDGGLYRTSRDGQAKYDAFLDDYACLAQALLALADAHTDVGAGDAWRERARELVDTLTRRFGDDTGLGGFYFTDRHATDLVVRQKTAVDSPLPSGNAAAAMALLALGDLDAARKVLAAFAQQMSNNGEGMSSMVQAALLYLRQVGEPFTVSADLADTTRLRRPSSPEQTAEAVVTVDGEWASPTELRLRLTIHPDFHINAHAPGGGPDLPLVPTRVTVDGFAPSDVTITYPPGDAMTLPFADAPVHVYGGEVVIPIRFATPVTTDLRLTLTYQPCDDRTCLPPVTQRLEMPAS